jgi:hypothetical protein
MASRAFAALLVVAGLNSTPLGGQDLESALREHLAVALLNGAEAGKGADAVLAETGRGSYLLPFLAAAFEDAGTGILALEVAARIAPREVLLWRDLLARCGRSDPPFLDAVDGILDSCPGVDTGALLAVGETTPAPALARAAARRAKPGDLAQLVRLAEHPALPVREEAVRVLAASEGGVAAAWAAREASALWRDPPTLAAMLVAAPPELLARLLDIAAERDARPVLAEAVACPLPGAAVLAELLARDVGGVGPFGALLAGTEPDLDDPAFVIRCAAAARAMVEGDPAREEARRLLPARDLRLASAEQVMALLPLARRAHAPFLAASLDLPGPADRGLVAERLAALGHPAGRAWIAGALAHFDPETRAAAFEALVRLRIPPPGDLVLSALAHESGLVRRAALQALSGTEAVLAPATVQQVLPGLGPGEAGPVLRALWRHPARRDSRSAALELLESGTPLRDAAGIAAALFDPVFPDALRLAEDALLAQAPLAVRRAALATLADAGAEGAEPPLSRLRLYERLLRDPDTEIRVHLARALARSRHDLARAGLVVLARDGAPLVRREAATGLGEAARFRVIPILRELGRDAHPWVRAEAWLGLLAAGDPAAAAGLASEAAADPVIGPRVRRRLLDAEGVEAVPGEGHDPAGLRRETTP